MLRLILLLFILNFHFCSLKYLRENRPIHSVQNVKRIFVIIDNFQETAQQLLLEDLIKNYLSHHTEFIVYKNRTKCEDFTKNQSGMMKFDFTEKELSKDKIELSLQVKLFDCQDKNVVFDNSLQKVYKLKIKENNSLYIENYKEKFGAEIQNRVQPYFRSVQNLLKNIPKPKLNDEDIEEKIDVES